MQWFNWILRGGRKEALPDYFVDALWLRAVYPCRRQARRVLTELLNAGPFSERQLRGLSADRLDDYVECLVHCLGAHGLDWIREHPAAVRGRFVRGAESHVPSPGRERKVNAAADWQPRRKTHSLSLGRVK